MCAMCLNDRNERILYVGLLLSLLLSISSGLTEAAAGKALLKPQGAKAFSFGTRPPLTKWIKENIPMLFSSGPVLTLQGSRLPSALKLHVTYPEQVIIIVYLEGGSSFLTACDPPHVGKVNHVSLLADELCDASGMRRSFPVGVAINKIIVWQDNKDAKSGKLGWVQPVFGETPVKASVEKAKLPAHKTTFTDLKILKVWEPNTHIRRFLPVPGRGGETWILPEAPYCLLAKDTGKSFRVTFPGNARAIDVGRSGSILWIGTAHKGLWKLENAAVTRVVGSNVDLGETVWRVVGHKDGSVAFLTDRGAFWLPGQPTGPKGKAKQGVNSTDLFQITGVLDAATAILQTGDSVAVFCADGRVLQLNKKTQKRSVLQFEWPSAKQYATPRFIVTDVGQTASGAIVLGTNHGLFRVASLSSTVPDRIHPASTLITQIEPDGRGGVLAATRDARGFQVLKGQEYARELIYDYNPPKQTPLNAIGSAFIGNGMIVGTEEAGLLGSKGLPAFSKPEGLKLAAGKNNLVVNVVPALDASGSKPRILPAAIGAGAKIKEPLAIFLNLDRKTRGKWDKTFPLALKPYEVTRRQAYWAAIPGRMDGDHNIIPYPPSLGPGPKTRPTDKTRLWLQKTNKGNPDSVTVSKTALGAEAYFDDHGEAYPGGYDGPGIRTAFYVPANETAILHVGLIAFSGMHSYTVLARPLVTGAQASSEIPSKYGTDSKGIAISYAPTANGITHARFLLINPLAEEQAFELFVDRCNSQNVRVAFIGLHLVRQQPGKSALATPETGTTRVTFDQDWGRLIARVWRESRSSAWVAKCTEAQGWLRRGMMDGGLDIADGLAFAGLTLDSKVADGIAGLLDDKMVLTKASEDHYLTLHSLTMQLGDVALPTEAMLKTGRNLVSALLKRTRDPIYKKTYDRKPLLGWLWNRGILGSVAMEQKMQPKQIMGLFKGVTSPLKRRLFAGYALHTAGAFSGEYALLALDYKTRILWKTYAAKEQQARSSLAQYRALPLNQRMAEADLRDMIKRRTMKIRKAYDQELIRMATAVVASAKQGKTSPASVKATLGTLWRDVKLTETKKIIEAMLNPKLAAKRKKDKKGKKGRGKRSNKR